MTIENILDQSRVGFERIASANKLVRWAEESQFAVQAYRRSIKLQQCLPETIQDAIINVAAVGLTLNPAMGYAYLVPEGVKIGDDWVQVCQLRISYKGLSKVATDSGAIEWLAADVVHKEDTFKHNGIWARPTHEMDPFSDRGAPVGVYCTVKLPGGDYITEVAPWEQVLKAKAAAKTKKVWDEWEGEMAKKFIIKRAAKRWPQSDHLNKTVDVINQYEGSEDLEKLEETAAYIIDHIANDDAGSVLEAYEELTDQEKSALFTAKTKGGWLTMAEKQFIRDASHQRWINSPEYAARQAEQEAIEGAVEDGQVEAEEPPL